MFLSRPNRLILCLFSLLFVQFVDAQDAIKEKIIENLSEIQSTTLQTPLEKVSNDVLKNQIPNEVLSRKQIFQIEKTSLVSIKNNKSKHLRMSIPISGQDVELQLMKAEIFSPDFRAVATSNPDVELEIEKGIHYWGTIKNSPKSLVVISFFDDEIIGMINLDSEHYALGKVKDSDYHILYKSTDLNFTPDISCESIPTNDTDIIDTTTSTEKAADKYVRIHLEADYSLYQKMESITNTTNYSYGVFAQVAVMFSNENIDIRISYLRIWDTASPYRNGKKLFDLNLQQYGRTHGDLVHLLHNNSGGGLAYVDQLCESFFNTGVSGVSGNYSNVPTYSWDVYLISHELGHNFGSSHTQNCVWNGGKQIDDCGNYAYATDNSPNTNPQPCYNSNNPILPNKGTIMSYCHLNVGINFNLGFGPQPGDLIRNKVDNATCLLNREDDNLALEGVASQSSTSHNGIASRAIDNNTSGKWSNRSVTHTSTQSQPSWQVRLKQDADIEQIQIYNRTDNCCSARLSNFTVFIYAANGSLVWSKSYASMPSSLLNINLDENGRTVKIRLNGTNPLSLAEVKVFGSYANSGGGGENPIVTIRKKNATGYALDGDHGGANNQNVYLWSYNSTNVNQRWVEIDRGGGYYSYQKLNTNYCIDGSSGGQNGKNVKLWVCGANNNNQQWQKVLVSGNTYRLLKRNASGFSIDGKNNGANRQNVHMWSNNTTNQNQQWVFTVVGSNRLEQAQDVELLVYPNPFSSNLTVALPSDIESDMMTIQLMDITGKIVYQREQLSTGQIIQISDDLPSGVYALKWVDEKNQLFHAQKVIKQ